MNTIGFAIGKLAFKPKYVVHGSKVSSNFEGGGKKGKDGSFVFAFSSQQPTKKPWANKIKTMHVWSDIVSATLLLLYSPHSQFFH
jgi:hypothetical protein